MIEIEFIEDFATKKAGESWSCDGQLAASLIRRGKAKVKTEEVKEEPKPKRRTRKKKTE